MTNSGISWLSQIPSTWPLVPIRYLFTPIKQLAGANHHQFQLLSLTSQGVTQHAADGRGKNSQNYAAYQIVQPGDLVVCLFDYDLTPRTIGQVQQTGIIAGAYTVLRPNPHVSSRFYYYFFLALDETKGLLHLCTGPRNGLTKPNFLSLKIPQPPLSTQNAIATHLDQETAKIDNLIIKQAQLLGLLTEKREAIIAHAISPWPSKRLSELFSINDDILKPNTNPKFKFDYVDISSTHRHTGITSREPVQFLNAPTRARRLVKAGDIIISTVRPELQSMALITNDTASIVASTAFAVLRPRDKISSKYYYYALQSPAFIAQLTANSSGVTYPAIKPGQLMALSIPLPNQPERKAITKYLNTEMAIIDQLKKCINKEIKLLKQRRTFLISSAVKGNMRSIALNNEGLECKSQTLSSII